MVHPLAGKPAPRELLVDVEELLRRYYDKPDPGDPQQRVSFGTSGHRGSSLRGSFNEAHILAITQAICEYRKAQGTTGPLFIGVDTHALSGPAQRNALEVLAANEVDVLRAREAEWTPTPAVSHAILVYNRGRTSGLADGIVVTPSHNPPEDGGFKYNPPSGGPADTAATAWIERRANELLTAQVRRADPVRAERIKEHDFRREYVEDLGSVIDFDPIRAARPHLAADPLGGASVTYGKAIAERYGIDLTVVNDRVDPTFSFVPVDHDGKIRMDCSSPYAMANLVALKDRYDLAFSTDTDADRHGVVTRGQGLLNPNHYLAASIEYLFRNRPGWNPRAAVGKTLVSSSLIDRVARELGRELREVPVGFKWFVDGLLDGSLGFGGEESAGGSFLRRDGTVWCTDKDGIIMDLVAAEMLGRTGKDPGQRVQEIMGRLGKPYYTRIDAPATPQQKSVLKKLSPESVRATTLAGQPIRAKLTRAPGNGAEIGGLKVIAEDGWFAARPSGTEDVFKIYAESFLGEDHLQTIVSEARQIVADALRGA
ncbi:MAG TPA: phosphoglucomutase (alpha-D-glucose-1,6-bisphosphate-dependent) [Myxococcales bacterium]|nr:phosphoglucomutase (alpha-D-glucose-1,6-bisphosphate-dependent) [Myxococcales bacterium]